MLRPLDPLSELFLYSPFFIWFSHCSALWQNHGSVYICILPSKSAAFGRSPIPYHGTALVSAKIVHPASDNGGLSFPQLFRSLLWFACVSYHVHVNFAFSVPISRNHYSGRWSSDRRSGTVDTWA